MIRPYMLIIFKREGLLNVQRLNYPKLPTSVQYVVLFDIYVCIHLIIDLFSIRSTLMEVVTFVVYILPNDFTLSSSCTPFVALSQRYCQIACDKSLICLEWVWGNDPWKKNNIMTLKCVNPYQTNTPSTLLTTWAVACLSSYKH